MEESLYDITEVLQDIHNDIQGEATLKTDIACTAEQLAIAEIWFRLC